LEFGELVFIEGGKQENLEKNPRGKARTNNKLNPLMAWGRNQTLGTLVGVECSNHSAIPAPHKIKCLPNLRRLLLSILKVLHYNDHLMNIF